MLEAMERAADAAALAAAVAAAEGGGGGASAPSRAIQGPPEAAVTVDAAAAAPSSALQSTPRLPSFHHSVPSGPLLPPTALPAPPMAARRSSFLRREHERRPSSCQPAVGASSARQFWLRRERSSEALERETVRV